MGWTLRSPRRPRPTNGGTSPIRPNIWRTRKIFWPYDPTSESRYGFGWRIVRWNGYPRAFLSSSFHLSYSCSTSLQDRNAVFILLLSGIDVYNLDIELFMYHIFNVCYYWGIEFTWPSLIVYLSQALQSDMYRSRNFDIILDCTSFTSKSELPLQWLKYCAELVPEDICMRFSTTRILNANTLTQKYLRRLYNISAGRSVYLCSFSCRLWGLGTSLCRDIFNTSATRRCGNSDSPVIGSCGY